MSAVDARRKSVLMLGTFGMRPKATMRSRALAIAQTLSAEFDFRIVTTPWDNTADSGKQWTEGGVEVVNTRSVRELLFPLVVREMVAQAHDQRSDLIHLFKPKGFGDLGARRLRRRLPIVVDMDDWEGNGGWNDVAGYGGLQRKLFDWQERTWPRQAAAVTVASRELQRRAIELGADPGSVFYLPNGLTRDHFCRLAAASDDVELTRQRLGLTGKRVVVLYTRFVEFTPNEVVAVLSQVCEIVPHAALLVIGGSESGEAERVMTTEAREAGIEDAIVNLGWTIPEQIPSLLALGEVAIHPFSDNLVNRSKCSVKLLELMAAGLPVVTNAVGQNREMIEDGISGMLVPPGETGAMARAVAALIGHRDRAEVISSAARERVERQFLWEQLAPRAVDAYNSALAQRPTLNRRGPRSY